MNHSIEQVINSINKSWSNNDILDLFEKYLNNNKFSWSEKTFAIAKIKELREKHKDQVINFTKNEQEQIENLFNEIIENNKENLNKKITQLIEVMDYTIQRELKETCDFGNQKKENPQKIIEQIWNIDFQWAWQIWDKYIWKSDYIVIITPQRHKAMLTETNDPAHISKIINIQKNILSINNTLFKNWVSKIFSFEWSRLMEYAKEIPNDIFTHYQVLFEELKQLSQNPKDNAEEIKQIEETMLKGWFELYMEDQHNMDIYSYGIENIFENNNGFFIKNVLDIIIESNPKDSKELNNQLNKYLIELKNQDPKFWKESWIRNNEIEAFIDQLSSIVQPKKLLEMQTWQYKIYLLKQFIEHSLNIRNQHIVTNLEQINKNTHSNAISLKIWLDHLKDNVDLWDPELNKYLSSIVDITSISDILKQKKISYIVIEPNWL